MVDGLTGRNGQSAPKSVAQEHSIEQDPAQTHLLNTAEQIAQGQTKKNKTATLMPVPVSFLGDYCFILYSIISHLFFR